MASTSGASGVVVPVGTTLFTHDFSGGDGLVTNSYASLYPATPGVVLSLDFGAWRRVQATADTKPDGSVALGL